MTATIWKQKVQIVTIAKQQLLLLEFCAERGGGYQNITGSVEDDETFLEGARRELLEEIGVSSELVDLHFSFQFRDRFNCEVEERVFLYHPQDKPTIRLSSEHQSYKWIPISEVKEGDFRYPTNYQAFLKALELYR